MNMVLSTIFDTSKYDTKTAKFRAVVIYFLLILITTFWLLYAISDPVWSLPDGERVTMLANAFSYPFGDAGIAFFGVYIMSAIGFYANRQGMGTLASWVPVLAWYCSGVVLLLKLTTSPGEASGAIQLLSILAGLLIGRRGLIIGWVLSLFTMIIFQINGVYADSAITVSNIATQMTAGAFVVYLFVRYAHINREEGATQAVEDRAVTAKILSQIAQSVAQRVPLEKLFTDIVNQVNENIKEVYHVQIFIVNDDQQTASLVASTGAVGQELIEHSHGLQVGSASVIGQVTDTGTPSIAIAGARGTIHRPNPLLPNTAVEAAFPFRVGDKVIGALDLQSTTADVFNDPNLVAGVQALADSIALAIDNVSQNEATRTQLAENERLVKQTQNALREVEHLNERLTGLAWSEYLQGDQGRIGFNMDFLEDDVQPEESGWTPTLKEALEVNTLVQDSRNNRQVIAIPLRVRGQVIGAMEFEIEQENPFTPEDFDMVQEVSERFGMAAENARLVDESQRIAQREALVNQISSRLQSTNNIETTLAEAARSLKDTLKAESIVIRLGVPPAE